MHLLCREAPVLTIAKCRDLDYYEREVIDGREDYLSEDGSSPGRWVGRLAEHDGLTGVADREALANAFDGIHPDGFKLTTHETSVAGFDLTLSPSSPCRWCGRSAATRTPARSRSPSTPPEQKSSDTWRPTLASSAEAMPERSSNPATA